MAKSGLFIAIEGGDGSGKGTQAKLLEERLRAEKKEVFRISFPQYGQPSAKIVEMYLNGEFGKAGEAPPELVSLAYAIDRFAAAQTLRDKLEAGTIIIADRYVASNLAHQAASIATAEKRKDFYELIKKAEYETLGIPIPDINIVLLVPTALAQANVDKKDARTYTNKKRDILEADSTHLDHAKRNYMELCELYPEDFMAVDCMDGSQLRPIPDIHEQIHSLVLQQM